MKCPSASIASALSIAMGIYLLTNRWHPRILARIHPARLAPWSFLAAMAHGAGLMLVPIFLGICTVGADETGHAAAQSLMGSNVATAFIVAFVNTVSMAIAGGAVALINYLRLGLNPCRRLGSTSISSGR